MTSLSTPVPATGRAPSVARPAALVLGSIASVQVGAAVAKQLFPTLGSTGTVAVRLAAAALVIGAVARPRIRGLTRSHLTLIVSFGLLLAGMNLCFYAALERIPLGIAVTVEFAGPLAVAVLGSRRAMDLVWVALAGVGVVLITGGGTALFDGSLNPAGVGLALLAAAGWAGYILLSQRVGAVLPSLQGLALALGVAALATAPLGVATAGTALLRPDLLAIGAAVGVLSSAVPWAFELIALRSLPAATFGVLMSLEPAVAALAGLALLHESLTPLQVVAIGITCVASAGACWGRARVG